MMCDGVDNTVNETEEQGWLDGWMAGWHIPKKNLSSKKWKIFIFPFFVLL